MQIRAQNLPRFPLDNLMQQLGASASDCCCASSCLDVYTKCAIRLVKSTHTILNNTRTHTPND